MKLLDNSWSSFGVLSLMIRCILVPSKSPTNWQVASSEIVTRVLVNHHTWRGVLPSKTRTETWSPLWTPTCKNIPLFIGWFFFLKVQKWDFEGEPGQLVQGSGITLRCKFKDSEHQCLTISCRFFSFKSMQEFFRVVPLSCCPGLAEYNLKTLDEPRCERDTKYLQNKMSWIFAL